MDVSFTLFRLRDQFRRAIEDPRRLRGLADPARVRTVLRSLRPPGRAHPAPWRLDADSGFQQRQYLSYESYVQHQAAKLAHLDLTQHEATYPVLLRQRLLSHGLVQPGMSVLCLGARRGGEVRAFRDLGCFAVGIDLNPGGGSEYVLVGDFHDLRFPHSCADVVFSNSLDHALDPRRLVKEAARVLKPAGLFVLEAIGGTDEPQRPGAGPGAYEAFFWRSVNDLVSLVTELGFVLESRVPFEEPWRGEHLCFRSKRSSPSTAPGD